MYNDSKNQWQEQNSGQVFLEQEDFFEKQGMMPNGNPSQLKKIGDIAANNFIGVDSSLNNREMMSPNMSNNEESIENNILPTISKEKMQESELNFSHGKEFTKNDGKITETEIKKLMQDPAAAYESIQSDKEEYLKRKFGRIFGERK